MACCLCCCLSKRTRRNVERKEQENQERDDASRAAKEFCENKTKYALEDGGRPRNIGGRLHKYWFVLREDTISEDTDSGVSSASPSPTPSTDIAIVPASTSSSHAYLSISPLPSGCPLDLSDSKTMERLNSILQKLQQHPFIHPIKEMEYLSEGKRVATVQKFHTERGSLRDIIFQEVPYRPKKKFHESLVPSWSKKYNNKRARPFSTEQIALFGRQILEGMTHLYDVGFQALGHVHTGNVFVVVDDDEKEACQVGGYEQTLLGYKTALYRDIQRNGVLKYIDVIMFGHVIFEMGTGLSLAGVCPTRGEYDCVQDESLREVLRLIFSKKSSIKKLLNAEFFLDQGATVQRKINKLKRVDRLSANEKTLLKKAAQLYEVKEKRSWFKRRSPAVSELNEPLLPE